MATAERRSVGPVISQKLEQMEMEYRPSINPKVEEEDKLEMVQDVHDNTEMISYFNTSIDNIKCIFTSQQGQTMFLERLIETLMKDYSS